MSGPTRALPDDLSKDPLLTALPRDPQGRPTLGGIPLTRCIGRGGMGAVYFATHPRLRIPVAVKILPTHLAQQDAGLANRFLSEARLAAALASDHLVRILDVNVESGLHYMVLEFVEGESAGARVKRLESLAEPEALDIVIAAARGLAAAHAKGIIHRDIKPDNILIPGNEPAKAKLADLGLAKPEPGRGETMGTLPDIALGTPGYMAPEQAENAKSAGPAADVFSMGATLQALLSGAPPFRGPTVIATIRETIEKPPAPLPPAVSAPVRAIVAKCLSKKAADRYPNAQALLDALLKLKSSMTASSRAPLYIVGAGAAIAALLIIGAVAFSGSGGTPGPGPFDEYFRAAEAASLIAKAKDTADAWNAVAEAAAKAEQNAKTPDETRKAKALGTSARERARVIAAREEDDRRYDACMKTAQEAKSPADAEKALKDALAIKPDDSAALAALKRVREATRPKEPVELRFKPRVGDVLTSKARVDSTTRSPRGPTGRSERQTTVSTFLLVSNGKLVKKKVEVLEQVSEQKGEGPVTSALQGRTLTVSMKDGRVHVEGADDVEERLVKMIKMDEDYVNWLPRQPVAVGDSWQIDAGAFFNNVFLRFAAADANKSAVTLTLREIREIDGRRCAVISETMDLKSKLLEIQGEGEMIVWIERGYVLSNKAQGVVKVRLGDRESDGTIAIEDVTAVRE